MNAERPTFDEWFRRFNSWDLGHEELLTLSMTPGADPGDVVWTSPKGSEMTRHVCLKWIEFFGSAQAGWNARAEQPQGDNQ